MGARRLCITRLRPSHDVNGVVSPTPPRRNSELVGSGQLNYTDGALAALDFSARNAKEMLRNFYKKSWDLAEGNEEAPYAYLIPEDQGDRARVADQCWTAAGTAD